MHGGGGVSALWHSLFMFWVQEKKEDWLLSLATRIETKLNVPAQINLVSNAP